MDGFLFFFWYAIENRNILALCSNDISVTLAVKKHEREDERTPVPSSFTRRTSTSGPREEPGAPIASTLLRNPRETKSSNPSSEPGTSQQPLHPNYTVTHSFPPTILLSPLSSLPPTPSITLLTNPLTSFLI